MASPGAILRAAKAVPGGARPTAPPQGAQIGTGQISPLALQLTEDAGYSRTYGHFLPRPATTFTQGAFGPFSPILPVPVDEPPPGADLPDARLWEGLVGYNLPSLPGSEGLKLASFSTLRTISDLYSTARTCIERRKAAVAGLDWDIVPTREAAKAYQGDHNAMRDFGERRAEAVKFFRQPDPDFFSFGGFMKSVLEQVFVFDALSILMKPKRGKRMRKGLLGSDLDCLNLIDGQTIRPLIGLHGEVPRPPAPATQQYLYGVPRSDYPTMITGRDIEEAGLTGLGAGKFNVDQMLYLPNNPRRQTPYGFSCTEQALIVILTGLQKQAYQLDYYREGCYASDTEVLTRDGWKLFPDLTDDDEVATRSAEGKPRWQKPSRRQRYPSEHDLLHYRSDDVDLLVTQQHRMLVTSADSDGSVLIAAQLRDFTPGEFGVLTCGAMPAAGMPDPAAERAVPLPAPEQVPYEGDVYCVTVPDGIIYVRRSGKAAWCGNTVPAVYISPGDVNITPTQIRELQEALNAFAGDIAWHHKIIVLPPGAHVMPQRTADLADQFDEFLANSVAMVYDVDPMSLGIIPQVSTVASPFAAKEMAQASRTVHERTSTKPLLKYLCDIFNAILHRVCGQDDMKFTYAGLDEAQDQAAQTDLLVKQVQNGIISIDEAREELQRTAWGLDESSGPLVFTQMGPVPLNQVIEMMRQQQPMQSGQQSPANTVAPVTGDTRPQGVHHPPSSRPVGTHNPRLGLPSGGSAGAGEIPPQRRGGVSDTPAHASARAHVASSPKPPSKAVHAEMEALARHLRKGRNISSWEPIHLSGTVMAVLGEDLTKGLGIDEAVRGALTVALPAGSYEWITKAQPPQDQNEQQAQLEQKYAKRIRAVFTQLATQAARLIRQWLSGALAVTAAALAAMIAALLAKLLAPVLADLWREAWHLGRSAAQQLLGITPPADDAALEAWIASHGRDWLETITRTREDDLADYLTGTPRSGQDADTIAARIPEVLDADNRSDLIAVTEAGRGQNAGTVALYGQSGVMQKRWITRGDAKVCANCKANAAENWISFCAAFQSGALSPLQHPNCRCKLAGRIAPYAQKYAGRSVDITGQEYWPAGSYPSGPAMGGGDQMPAAHDADGIQQYIPGGVPAMTAAGGPPRWDGGEADHSVASSPRTDSAGRGDVQTGGGGTVEGPYADLSDRTQVNYAGDGDDSAWPGEREVGPVAGTSWPAPYMDGYWPRGGHGTTQPPGGPVAGGTGRGRSPNAAGKASGYTLNPRAGMISLDIADGTIEPVAGGVSDHHVTVAYLGPDVDDGAFALACLRAQAAAAAMPGPLAGVIAGVGSFEPSAGSDGKVPAWAGVMLPGAEQLREALADLSASEHRGWHPHVTLAYLEAGEPLPEARPPVPVTFTHVSVHRGDQVERFPLGTAPAAVTKDAADLTDPNPVEATHVKNQLRANFPEKALTWIDDATWIGPVHIPLDRVNFASEDSWAASHQPDAVKRFAREMKAGTGHTDPVVMVQVPGESKADVVDGHHRTLACRHLGWPVKAYVGFVPAGDERWQETHSSQVHQGGDPANKGAGNPVAAGLAVRAASTGRILMLQRAFDEDDDAGGFWEFPGGRLDDGEDALDAARREWAEETGCEVPDGDLSGIWNASNGKYRGFVLTVPDEDGVPVFGDRDAVTNPDDPDGDMTEALAWWDPGQLKDNPAVRPELAEDVKRVRRALKAAAAKSAETPYLATRHAPIGHEGLWHSKHPPLQLPAYIQNIRNALMRDGHSEEEAHALAVAAVERWAQGDLRWGPHRKVTPEVVAASREALREWEELRASHP